MRVWNRVLAIAASSGNLPARRAAATSIAFALAASTAAARHVAREDPSEPIFTERSFVERNAEVDVGGAFDEDEADQLDLAAGASWTFANRFQLGLDVPYGVRFPEDGSTRSSLADVGISAQFVFCCAKPAGFAFVSARAEVEAPTGNRSKGIGGDGAVELSLLGGYGLTVVEAWDDLGIQAQLSYAQEIRGPDEKQLLWNLALTQPLFGRVLTPVLELLGTTTLEAGDPGEEGSGVELGVGFWIAPFGAGAFSPASFALGYRFPATSRRQDDGAVLLILEWTFD